MPRLVNVRTRSQQDNHRARSNPLHTTTFSAPWHHADHRCATLTPMLAVALSTPCTAHTSTHAVTVVWQPLRRCGHTSGTVPWQPWHSVVARPRRCSSPHMKIRVGILGLPNVGKSSLFNALAQQSIAQGERLQIFKLQKSRLNLEYSRWIHAIGILEGRLIVSARLTNPKR